MIRYNEKCKMRKCKMIEEIRYEVNEEEYYEETDERSDYERRWWDSTYYEDSRFL